MKFAPVVLLSLTSFLYSSQPSLLTVKEGMAKFDDRPLIFEPNLGQANWRVRFVARTPESTLYFTPQGVTVTLPKREHARAYFRVTFEGAASSPVIVGKRLLASKSNYLDAYRPARSISDIGNFGSVEYSNIYPGINVRYYGTCGRLENDFAILPGSNPSRVVLHFVGISGLQLSRNGDLNFSVNGIAMVQTTPSAYQVISGRKVKVAANYLLLGNDRIGFGLRNWDKRYPLVIDPILANSTYLGGNTQQDYSQGTTLPAQTVVTSISADLKQNVYITGITTAADFPVTSGAYRTDPTQVSVFHDDTVSQSGFVTKLGKFGELIYSTYLLDSIAAGSASPEGFVYVVKNGFDNFRGPGIGIDPGVQIVKLDQTGSHVLYSYNYAGSPSQVCNGICTWATGVSATYNGQVWIGGNNTEVALKTTPGAYQPSAPSGGANIDGFVARFDTTKTGNASLVAATYIGGSNGDDVVAAVATDIELGASHSPSIYDIANVVGTTSSSDFPHGADFNSGSTDSGFVAQISPDGQKLVYSTLLHDMVPTSVATRSVDIGYVGGWTTSITIPVGANAVQKHNAGGRDGFFLSFVTFLGGAITNATYIGGSKDDSVTGVGSFYDPDRGDWAQGLVGWTESSDFPTTPYAFQKTNPTLAGRSAFAAAYKFIDGSISPTLPIQYSYSSYVGPVASDPIFGVPSPAGMTLTNLSNAWIGGTTDSPHYPAKYSPVQSSLHGLQSGFASKIVVKTDLGVTAHANTTQVKNGDVMVYHIRAVNHGPDPASQATLMVSLVGPHTADRQLLGVKTSSKDASCPSANTSSIFCFLGPTGEMPPHAVYYVDVYMRALSKIPVTYPFFVNIGSQTQELITNDNKVSISITQP